jgi:hypothetical protein
LRRISGSRKRKGPDNGPTILGITEAVGTVLLLGISIVMVGGLAVWTSQIEGVEEGLYVDLWSSVSGDQVTITHRGGDILDGQNTEIILRNSDGSLGISYMYYDVGEGRTDEYWNTGEEITIDASSLTQEFKLIVTTIKENGASIVILRNDLIKGSSDIGKPDLAVTRIHFTDPSGVDAHFLYETGKFHILIDITNFGSDIDTIYFQENADLTVQNLVVYDSEGDLYVTNIEFEHYDISKDLIDPGDAEWGRLKTGEKMVVNLSWDNPQLQEASRTLGLHDLGVKVISHPDGEMDYRNNVVTKKFQVEKKVLPIIPIGPDPGIRSGCYRCRSELRLFALNR